MTLAVLTTGCGRAVERNVGSDTGGGASVEFDDDGISVTSDDEQRANGESAYSAGPGIPDQWPGDVPRPDGLDDVTGAYFSDSDRKNVVIVGTTTDAAADTLDAYGQRLVDAGWTEQSRKADGDMLVSATYTKADTSISVSADSSDDTTDVNISFTS